MQRCKSGYIADRTNKTSVAYITERETSSEKHILYTGIKSSCKSFVPFTYPHFLIEPQPFSLQYLSKGNGKKHKSQYAIF